MKMAIENGDRIAIEIAIENSDTDGYRNGYRRRR